MGGLPCAKTIIDNMNALIQQMQCMTASIHLNSTRIQPTYKMQYEFLEATDQVARVAARIEKYVSGDEEEDKKDDNDDKHGHYDEVKGEVIP